MANVPKRVEERLVNGLKRYQPVITAAKNRDVNESDTVTIVTDILSDLFGYDKYAEVTREFCIRGNYCDLAVKIDNKVHVLIEVKAIGLDLKENHLRQAVDYASNQGVEWVVLTNGYTWRIHRVLFNKPIANELILDFSIPELSPKSDQHLEWLFLLTKEAISKSALAEFHSLKQVNNRFTVASFLVNEPILSAIRREMRRMYPTVNVKVEDLQEMLLTEVLKREIVDGESFKEAVKRIERAAKKAQREAQSKPAAAPIAPEPDIEPTPAEETLEEQPVLLASDSQE